MDTPLPGGGVATGLCGITLATVLAVCTVADLRSRIVPNRALAAGAVVALAAIVLADPGALSGRAGAAAGAGCFLLAPALISPGSIGMGDVKLAALLGLYLGPSVVTALLAAFLAGTLTGSMMLIRHGPAARRMAIPFAPYLALGGVLSFV